MKKNFSKSSHREKIDKVERRASVPGVSVKEKNSNRRLSIYDDFEEDELDHFDSRSLKPIKPKR